MIPAEWAIAYAGICFLPVFPCIPHGPHRKDPLTPHGFKDASCTPSVIARWWGRWPNALIGMPTGPASGRYVLDVDVKDPERTGFDTLADLGYDAFLPETPLVHTASGGIHLHFDASGPEIRNTAGKHGRRGIGAGLDWRGTGGYVILPSPGSGYSWDADCGLNTPLASVPDDLRPRDPVRLVSSTAKPIEPVDGLSRYAAAALEGACRKIIAAPNGEQDATLVAECFSIGTLAGAGGIPEGFARDALLWAAGKMPSHDQHHPWLARDLEHKVDRALDAGKAHPRGGRRYG
jgi:putative DNA primase/helicase